MPHHEGLPGKHWGQLGGKGSEWEMWARDFVVISLGRNKLNRVIMFRIG